MGKIRCPYCGGINNMHDAYCPSVFIGDFGIGSSDSNQREEYKPADVDFDDKLGQLCQYLDALILIEVVLDSEIELKNMDRLQALYNKLLKKTDETIGDLDG